MTGGQQKAVDLAKPFIKKSEALRLTAYKHKNDPWTIGWGHTRTARPGMVISKEQAERLLAQDMETAYSAVFFAYPNLNVNRQAALISFSFNVGTGWLYGTNTKKALDKGLQTGDWESFTTWFSKWIEKGSIFEKGLIERRAEELKLFFCPTT